MSLDEATDSISAMKDLIDDKYPMSNPNAYISVVTSLMITNSLGFTPEPSFSKNTAFNKNFGTSSNTIAEGNDTRINNGQTAFGWGNHALANYLTSINSSMITTALGYTPYNGATNPLGFLTTASLPKPSYRKTNTVAGGAGNVVFYLTNDNTSTGTALYTSVDYIAPIVNDASKNYTYGWTISGDLKTLTVNVKAVGTTNALINLLGGLLPVLTPATNVPNGTSVSVFVTGN